MDYGAGESTRVARRMFVPFTAWILRHRWLTLAGLVLVIAAVSGGLAVLKADFAVKVFYPDSHPATAYLEESQERWGGGDMLILVAEGDEDGGLLAGDRLRQLDAFADELATVDGVGRILSVTKVMRPGKVALGGRRIPEPLLATAPKDPERFEAWKTKLLDDASVVPTYLSKDGRYGAILIALDVNADDLTQVKPVVNAIQAKVADAHVEGLTFYLGGVPAIRADVLDVIVRDQLVAVPISAFLMGALLISLFRSRHGVFIPILAAAVPNMMLLGVMGWAGESFGLLNQVYLALVPAIAVADAVHLVSRYHEESEAEAAGGELDIAGRDRAIANTMGVMGVACFLTSFTTIVGFMSLMTTSMPVLRNFGLFAAVGVALAYFTVIFIVPLALLGTTPKAKHVSHGTEGILGRVLDWCVMMTTRHAGMVTGLALLLTGAAMAAGTMVVTDWSVTKSFDEDHPVSLANRTIDDHMGGVLGLDLDLEGEPGSFEDPEVLAAIDGLEQEARALGAVRTTIAPPSMLAAISGLTRGLERVPTTEGQAKVLYNDGKGSDLIEGIVKPDRSAARVLIRVKDEGSVAFLAMTDEIVERFREVLTPLGISVEPTGAAYVSSLGIRSVTVDLRTSLITAFLIIGIVIALLFRSPRYGLLSLIPNALPLLLGYGMMGLLGWELEPARAVVFTIAIGVSVDSAIHILARFEEERRNGATVDEAIASSILHSGRAILITTIMLMVGFGANINSAAPANSAFGRLGSIVIAGAILANLLVLPAMLKLAVREEPREA